MMDRLAELFGHNRRWRTGTEARPSGVKPTENSGYKKTGRKFSGPFVFSDSVKP